MSDAENILESICFYQGGEKISNGDCLKAIKQKVTELCNVKNVHFLLGAGTSSGAIPSMKVMQEDISKDIESTENVEIKKLYRNINSDNLEKTLNILYAKKYFLEGCANTGSSQEVKVVSDETEIVDMLIKYIQDAMFSRINSDFSKETATTTLELYKRFYQKIVLRNKDLARANIFTTNNDLFNEKALDDLNINYNNGFGGGHERAFNPARFRYTLSKKIDANLEKFEPIENMVYLYKLHGSISWIEKEGNSLFNIQEISVTGGTSKKENNHVLIYPTPLKQTQSLGSPYSDLIREFQTKLALQNSVLFIIGYSFSDEHLNNIIYQTLASNSSISIVIFGEYAAAPLSIINDSRIYRVFGEDSDKRKIHYFEYIVDSILPFADENKDQTLIDDFIKAFKEATTSGGVQ
ncbi:SIR2 family protein [Legionella pneumophila serogroup 1]